MPLTRRQFLAFTSLSALSWAFRPVPEIKRTEFAGNSGRPLPPEDQPPAEYGLGRVIAPRVTIRREPHPKAEKVHYRYADRLINLWSAVESDGPPEHNRVWFEVAGGYVHSSWIQPVRFNLQTPLGEFPGENFLVEVSVPFTDARRVPHRHGQRIYRHYYGTTHWVTALHPDSDGEVWYRIRDDKWGTRSYMRGRHLRRILPEEFAPLSPGVIDKRLEVNIQTQWATAFEDGREVFTTRTATGDWYEVNGQWKDYTTPLGEHRLIRKTPSRHMAAGDRASGEGYDLPGVPWVSYFTSSGVAFHGTYWHNDFGRQRSHGCVNVTTEAAKWIYRWSLPHVPAHEPYLAEPGTQVIVFDPR